jgi:membrane protein DedA with SNARE-associated domain
MKAFWWIMGASLLSEDATLAASAALWASGRLEFQSAFWGSLLGIGLGDMGLYGVGRGFGPRLIRMFPGPWVERGKKFLSGNLSGLVLLSRFIPGARLTGYTAAGILKAPFASFCLAVWFSTLLWVGLWFGLCGPLGAHFSWAWLLPSVLLAMLALEWFLRGFQAYEWRLRRLDLARLRYPEFWPAWLFYIPVAFNYVYLSFRYGGPTLPSYSNPGIENGGLINESKSRIFSLIPPGTPELLPYRSWEPGSKPQGEAWPLIAKPDAGQRGSGVRLLRSQAELDAYAAAADYRFITQDFSALPMEAGVFYLRFPEEKEGRIFSLTRKLFPEIEGDGDSTLAALILKEPRNRYMARVLFKRHEARLGEILAKGEGLRLVESGNHCQGAVFLNGAALAQEGLRQRLDAIARSMPGFLVGRFDLRYLDDESFARGKNFQIVEVNGAASEATHVYDPAIPLREIYATLFTQWRCIFEIGQKNKRLGLGGSSARELLHCLLEYRRSSRHHPIAS